MFSYPNNSKSEILIWIEPWAFEIKLPKLSVLLIWLKNKGQINVDVQHDVFDGLNYTVLSINSINEINYDIVTNNPPLVQEGIKNKE